MLGRFANRRPLAAKATCCLLCVACVSVCVCNKRFLPRNYLAMNIIYDRALVGVVLVRDTFPSTGEACTAEDELALLTAVEGRSKSVRHTLGVTRSRVSR